MIKNKYKIKSRNIPLLCFMNFLQGMVFFAPILALYYQESLFTVKNVALIFSIEALASVIFEVPTGAIADLFGRKRTLILAIIADIVAIIILYIGGSMIAFILASIIGALSRSLNSGTDAALMYDSLKNEGKEKYYKKISGIYMSIWPAAAAIGSIVGGHLATISLKTPIIYTLVPLAFSLIISFFLTEQKYEKKKDNTINSHMLESAKDVLKNKQMLIILCGGIVAWSFGESVHSLSQIFYQYKEIPIMWYGYILAFGFGVSSLGFYLSHDVSARLGNKKTVILSVFMAFLFLIIATQTPSYIAAIFFTLSAFFFGLRSPILGHLWNEEAESRKRATLNSINSLVNQLGIAIVAPIIGYWADLFTINTAFLLSGIITIIISTSFFAFLKKN